MIFRWLRRTAEPVRMDATALGRKDYPGDWTGPVHFDYTPHPDGLADPGEVVWTWVPFEEDHTRGKDRPVLIIGRRGDYLLGLMLTSKDHTRSADVAKHWIDVGAGDWDGRHRPSEARLDRVLQLFPSKVRREGAALARPVFERVARAFSETGRRQQ